MNRTALVRIFAAVAVVALLLAIVPFFVSLSPSERSISALPRISVPNLSPGQFAIVDDPLATAEWPSKLMLLRQRNGELFVWSIPTRNGVIAMPDFNWWRPGVLCLSFAPDFSKDVIACIDPNIGEWAREHFRWHLDGKSTNGIVADMPRVHGQEALGEFVYSMRRG